MEQKLLEEIDISIASGVPLNLVADDLIGKGWPSDLVNAQLGIWLQNHASIAHESDGGLKKWLQKYYRMARPAIITVVVLNLFDTGIALLKPWPVKIMADSVFGDVKPWAILDGYEKTTLLLITSLMTIALFILGAAFGTFRDYFLLKIGFGLNRSIKEESLRHILHLPLFHQERLAKGDYVYRQNVVTNSLSDLVLGTTSAIIQSILIIIGVLIIMLIINPQLTLISVILLPLLFLSIKIIGPKMGFWAQKYTENASETSASITESVDNAEAIQSFTLEEKMVKKVNNLWVDSYHYTQKNLLWGELLDGINGLLVTVATSSVMFVGGAAALNAEVSFGDLLIFMTYMGYLIGPVETLIDQITTRNQKLIDVSRIYDVMIDHEGIEFLRQENHMPPNIKGSVELKNISYAYKDQTILNNLSLSIPAGQKIAIIGPSGSGKSTILKLIPLFIEPNQGEITIDGFGTQNVSLKELRKHIAWVSQSPQLFNETIVENLLEGDVDRYVSNEEIADAVEVSNISEFVLDMPLSFETPVGENGGSLSGGQKQRISIARALIKNAPIICLDEPTAALDIKSENYIRDSLAQMIQGKTVIMVTHRKPLLALMDVVYVLQDGQLVDVNQLGGLYAYLGQLEGIEQQEATQEMAFDSQDNQEFLEKIAEYLSSNREQPEVSNPNNTMAQTPIVDQQTIQPTSGGIQPKNYQDSTENDGVVINLH